jgi:phosphohistidine phosphatase SixA
MRLVTLLLVRHADAGDKRRWRTDDRQRPLTVLGRRQAVGLLAALDKFVIQRILCSPLLRCRQTVMPVARQRGLTVELTEALAPDATVWQLEDLLGDGKNEDTLYCTHGEDLQTLFSHWSAENAIDLPGYALWEKGGTWVLSGEPDARPTARYLPPVLRSDDLTTRDREWPPNGADSIWDD